MKKPKMSKVIFALERIAEQAETEDSSIAMRMLRSINHTYHWCPDWDDAVISDKHSEFECCTCSKAGFHRGITHEDR
jgi:hypothetical protein